MPSQCHRGIARPSPMTAPPDGDVRWRALGAVPWHAPWHGAVPDAPDRTVADIDMQQSAVCQPLNVWPSVPMHDVRDGVATVVGTWYWCYGVWLGFHRRGQLGTVTDWLA